MSVKTGDTVLVHYTGTLDDGTTFDSSVGREPLEFTVGSGQVIKGFDHALLGMKINEEKDIVIPAKEAYGEMREDLILEIPKERMPGEVAPGMTLLFKDPQGNNVPLKVKAVSATGVTVDLNHPLAGQTLHFKLTLVSIK